MQPDCIVYKSILEEAIDGKGKASLLDQRHPREYKAAWICNLKYSSSFAEISFNK